MKKKTIEESAEKYANEWEEIHGLNWDNLNLTPEQISQLDFKTVAKWQEEQAKETQKLTMINALVEFSIAHFDIHTEEAILNITRRAEKYYNQTFKSE
jgi:homoserine trans-succinylase